MCETHLLSQHRTSDYHCQTFMRASGNCRNITVINFSYLLLFQFLSSMKVPPTFKAANVHSTQV